MTKCTRVIDYPFEWDVLIILDACRFDAFKSVYKKFFSGKLIKAYSCGSATAEWFYNNFVDFKLNDTIYISSNPYIGNIERSTRTRKLRLIRFNARNHFYKVIDVWRTRWNNGIDTVHPFDTTLEAIRLVKRYGGNKRLIVHYMQPHAPYISCHRVFKKVTGLEERKRRAKNRHLALLWYLFRNLYLFYNLFGFMLLDLFLGDQPFSTIIDKLFLPYLSLLNAYARIFGKNRVRLCYLDNLYKTLMYSTSLVSYALQLGLRVVITADHGEFLGESNSWGHWGESNRLILREIPIFQVNSTRFVYRHPKLDLIKRIKIY